MSLFAELELPPEAFALADTLAALPDAAIEVERVVAAEDILTPYFWVANVSAEAFEAAAGDDPSIRDVRRLDTFEEATLYRAEWTETIESAVAAFTRVGAVILDAVGQHDRWEVQLRFDDRDQLVEFQTYCADNDVDFRIKRLYEVASAHTGRQYGLTEKQHEALVAAWEAGFFESPAEATLSEIAADLDISQQALSQRMRKGYDGLIASTLVTEHPGDE
ncbi:Predicted DNA binding protein, contains HTH domain [Halomicrobium zhouii]|uniref:Predicted DNA binding protein, contains HTH domain n=1 Tax=Halomicrobium zhouii TaxID=767519 RepID=A0A1I6K1M1_9EURY|nr:bacterio-opsin activator domain-containing protein [Halomicrobium zhouii]SFR85101.1 Predicted DNA binding protein, contains HTH domain [Halomicrobium zhouii]